MTKFQFDREVAQSGYFAVRLLKGGAGEPIGIRLDAVVAWVDHIGSKTAETAHGEVWGPTIQRPDGSVARPDGSTAPSVESWYIDYRQIWQNAIRSGVTL